MSILFYLIATPALAYCLKFAFALTFPQGVVIAFMFWVVVDALSRRR